jgi:hypothetical protein
MDRLTIALFLLVVFVSAAEAQVSGDRGTAECLASQRRGSHPRWRCAPPNAITAIADEILFVGRQDL